jgi:hypothetical protein
MVVVGVADRGRHHLGDIPLLPDLQGRLAPSGRAGYYWLLPGA